MKNVRFISRGERAAQAAIALAVLILSLICLLPMVLVLVNSFAEESALLRDGYSFFPRALSLKAYQSLFYVGSPTLRSYGITLLVTGAGTLSALLITYLCAFALANPNFPYRNGFSLFFFITTVFNPGLVPWYLMSKMLGMYDNVWALLVPSMLFTPFNMFLCRNFIRGIPDSLMDSGRIDGAGEARIAFQIYLPLCAPVAATVGLFYALSYWNNWFNAVMLLDDTRLYPLQMILFKIQSDLRMLRELKNVSAFGADAIPTESFKMAAAVVTVGPIALLYPFLQKYFARGLVIGAVKG